MLTVRNLPPEPTWQDWLKEQLPLIKGLALWVTAMCCLVILWSPTGNGEWYLLSESDGALIAMPMSNESSCLQRMGDGADLCALGPMPRGTEASLMAP